MTEEEAMIHHKTEDSEGGLTIPSTPLEFGSWKVNVHERSYGDKIGFRRYHKHGKKWYSVYSEGMVSDGMVFHCCNCTETTPEEMEGYIKLARWSISDH